MKHGFAKIKTTFGIGALILILCSCSNASSPGAPSVSPSSPISSPPVTSVPSPSGSSPSETSSSEKPPSSDKDDISRLLESMTLEQKVGQLIIAGIDGTKFDEKMQQLITNQQVGGVILYKDNFSDLEGSVRLVNELKQGNADNPLPLFMSVDQEGGTVSRLPKDFAALPNAMKVGKTGKPELAEEMGGLLSKELRIMGFNMDFAPVLDVNSNPKNPVIGSRSFGTDAKLVADMGVAAMRGLQAGGTIAVVKHFPGHGDTSVDSHLELPTVPKTVEQLEKLEWIPFRAAIDQGADAVMIAHILFPSIDPDSPSSLSKAVITDLLRDRLGYGGVVITDDMTMGAIARNYGIEEAALQSFLAGSDLILVAHGYDTASQVYDKLLEAAQSGVISEARLDASLRRIISLKQQYKLSDESIPIPTATALPNEEIKQWLSQLQ
ncbi:beta-N-acetylhexosaminidase [Cohnella sp. LGH]|uniref:beta-N-acetylhexosaminidase n=1 Tax=Cohnella sp. LGH TaxID=1619153 RepID=UPI001AD9C4AC|nr:beta-N-acetylhexosaminidase [Cohnella sp. LGH]QTH46071.1 beta-N-acetylhexosaminidase [Cohnella sp. LGH]